MNSVTDLQEIGVGANFKLETSQCFLTEVVASTLFFSLIVLLLIVMAFIGFIMCAQWRLTTCIGVIMICFYGLFVIQDLVRNPDIVGADFAENAFGWTNF